MKTNMPLTEEKKLTILVRVEPGCLGPEGASHIEEFCRAAQIEFASIESDVVHFQVEPRFDKSLAEIQYTIINRPITTEQAAKYMKMFNKDLDELEGHVYEKLAMLIDQYLER